MKCFFISIIHFTIIAYCIHTCEAQNTYHFVDTRAYSMGNTLSVLPGFTNPAGYGFEYSRHIALQYVNRYGVKELSTYAGMINFPNKYLDTGLYVSRYGIDAYNETTVSMNFYKKLSGYLSLGIRINYLNLHYSGRESNKSLLTGDIGLLTRPVKNCTFSVLAINPLQTTFKAGEEELEIPALLLVGVSYQPVNNFLLTAEVEKDFAYPVVCKVGIEYAPIPQLSVRGGMSGKPFTPSFGAGIHISSFTVDLGFSRHPVLGFRSCCGLQFNF